MEPFQNGGKGESLESVGGLRRRAGVGCLDCNVCSILGESRLWPPSIKLFDPLLCGRGRIAEIDGGGNGVGSEFSGYKWSLVPLKTRGKITLFILPC